MVDYNQNFKVAYDRLNPAQKEAVHEIEGPVMVVAGPGTGKTQLLAARIGYILANTDTSAHNILCLTFTEAGVLAMRERLLSFIGPEAYNVSLFTYHAFSNRIIQDNIELFGGYLEMDMLSELEQVDVFMELIDTFGDEHLLKVFKGDTYLHKPRLINLFKTMKAENWDASQIVDAVERLPEYLADQEEFIYKRGYTDKKTGKKYEKGDVKESAIQKAVEKYDKLMVAAHELDKYKSILEAHKRYDYQDMILWVLEQFKSNSDLLLEYQEKYQYILVDEYQDTNGSQNELIYQLANYWENPNLFVVGDDDQSIFRFQGANMDNIIDFKKKFEPKVIVLEENYRSGSDILDSATRLIDNNKERLANSESSISKSLIESRQEKSPGTITYTKYHNLVHEEKSIINKILELQKDGFPLNEVAVIYRNHKHAANIIRYLEFLDVPLNVKKKIDILHLPAIQQLISMLRYLAEEIKKPFSADHRLFEILHFSYFEINPRDIAKISMSIYEQNQKIRRDNQEEEVKKSELKWRNVIADEAWLSAISLAEPENILKFGAILEQWIKDAHNFTVQILLEKILTDSTMLEDILGGENSTFMLQVVSTFFDFVKDESTSNPRLKLHELLDTIKKMEDNKLAISFNRIVHSKQGVHFMTAHGSKGLEFEKVFLIRCTQYDWIDKKSFHFQYKFPETIVAASAKSDEEDDRRLFFVAMTRAKNEVHISYPAVNEKEKGMEAVKFITEITSPDNIVSSSLEDAEIEKYKFELMRFRKGKVQLIDPGLIDHVLKDYIMSVTNLNKYLDCPRSFYFEVILRVPQARSPYLGYGNAIHKTLQRLFSDIEEAPERLIPPLDIVLDVYSESLEHFRQHFTDKEYKNYQSLGIKILTQYYETFESGWSTPRKYELEYKVRNVEYGGIPIKGDLDKVVYHDDHFYVVDYKTGSYKSDKFAEPIDGEKGGDYWRQIVFYKMLVDKDPHFTKNMKYGLIDFVEPDKRDNKYKSKKIEVSSFDLEVVSEQLKTTYESIKNHEFDTGCEDENCRWCNFVADHLNAGE